jgi:hypothetical protein
VQSQWDLHFLLCVLSVVKHCRATCLVGPVIILVLNEGELREGGLSDVIKESFFLPSSSLEWKFNVRVLIKSFSVGVWVSLCICVLSIVSHKFSTSCDNPGFKLG